MSMTTATTRRTEIEPSAGFSWFEDTEIEQSLPSRFARQVGKHGDRVAVKTTDATLTYRELDARSNQIARRLLAELGPGHGSVGLLFEHGAEMIAASLGVLKAGKAYVPLDAAYPAERLRYMLDDSQARGLVTNARNAPLAESMAADRVKLLRVEAVPSSEDASPAAVEIDPHSTAYLLYTSGSTGKPKGVPQTHRNVLHHMRIWTNSLKIAPEDRLTLQSAYSWDSAVQDTFGALLNGAALYPVSFKEDGIHRLLDWFLQERVTIYHSTLPIYRSLVRAMAATGKRASSMRALVLGGDSIYRSDVDLYRQYFSPECVLVNAYGATESTTALLSLVHADRAVDSPVLDLGYPVPETDVHLVGDDGARLEGPGEGEIRIRSRYISPGYWRLPASEPSRFLPDPEGGDRRVYCTGDIGRRLADGSIALVGRKDFQVKIRGIRVELGEVEGVLKQLDTIDDAVVLARDDEQGERFLTAYVVLKEGRTTTVGELRVYLSQRVPDHAVPSRYVFLSALPLTPNNKIDRAALPAPGRERPRLDAEYVAPGTRLEETVAAVWREVLSLDEVGMLDNFFDLGGNSLRLASVNARLREITGREIPMVAMYQHPTVRALAQSLDPRVEEASAAQRGAARARIREELRGRAAEEPRRARRREKG